MKIVIEGVKRKLNTIRDFVIGIVVFDNNMNRIDLIIDDNPDLMRLLRITQWGVIQESATTKETLEKNGCYIHIFDDETSLADLLDDPIKFNEMLEEVKAKLNV